MGRRKREVDYNSLPTRRQTDKCRTAIKTSHIVRRLQQNFDGELPEPLTPTQLKSAELLLQRTLPVLSSMEVTQETYDPTGDDPMEIQRQFHKMAEEYLEKLPDERKLELLTDGQIESKQLVS